MLLWQPMTINNLNDITNRLQISKDYVSTRIFLDLEEAQTGNYKIEALAETKLLNYNLDISCFIVIGKVKARIEMQQQLQNCPLILCGANMKD